MARTDRTPYRYHSDPSQIAPTSHSLHDVALEMRILDEALGAELQWIGKDVRVEMDKG